MSFLTRLGGAFSFRIVRPLFSRFVGRGSRFVASATPATSKFLAKTKAFFGGRRVRWFWGIVRDVALWSAIDAGIEWITGNVDDETDAGKSAQRRIFFKDLFLNDLVRLALDIREVSDMETPCVILDNYAIMKLASDEMIPTMEGLATAAAAEYFRLTTNGGFVYDLPDALDIIAQFEELVDGKELSQVERLTDAELDEAVTSIEEVEKELGSQPYTTTSDLLAFQMKYIIDLQNT